MQSSDIVPDEAPAGHRPDSPILDEDSPERAAEHCRLALQKINQHGASLTPLNYALFYHHAAGSDRLFSEKMDAVLGREAEWRHDTALRLFLRYLTPCNDISMMTLQEDMQFLLRGVIESTRTAADVVDQHSDSLDKQVAAMAACRDPREALQLAAEVLHETRALTEESKQLAAKMHATVEEVEKLNAELARARRDASVDTLTGLGNRARFEEELNRVIGKAGPFGLIIMDIDHFKAINDAHGHLIGDRVLCQFARVLSTRTRSTDIVTRYGGEEFAIILPDTKIQDTRRVAENLRASIRQLNMRRTDTGADLGRITASFGLTIRRSGDTAHDLIARADDALYQAKKNGRDCVEVAEVDAER